MMDLVPTSNGEFTTSWQILYSASHLSTNALATVYLRTHTNIFEGSRAFQATVYACTSTLAVTYVN